MNPNPISTSPTSFAAFLRSTLSLIMGVLLLAIFCPGAFAQVDQGSITGTITDQTGAVIPNATVTLTNTDNNLVMTRSTNSNGLYTFTPIKVGHYTLKAGAKGFETTEQDNIRVNVSDQIGLNFVLHPGRVDLTVTVTATTDMQTEDASTGQVFSTEQINDAPLINRNFYFMAQLTTGVSSPNQGNSQTSQSGGFASNGSRVSQNNFILDGVDNNSNMQDFLNGATYSVRPPPDALEEFKVQTSDYSAELGHSTGAAVNAAIKSGTNKIHGSLWEYIRNDAYDARDYFQQSSRTAYHENIFGGTLSGPIIKDKLFLFADGQGTRISIFAPESQGNTVPTAAMRTGDFSEMLDANNTAYYGTGPILLYKTGGNIMPDPTTGEITKDPSRYLACPTATGVVDNTDAIVPGQNVICSTSLDSVAKTILNLFPLPDKGKEHQVFGNYTIPATADTDNTTQYDVRVDYNPTAKDQAFARYSHSIDPQTFAPPFPILDGGGFGSDGQDTNNSKSAVLSETHFFTPTLANEFRFGYNWLHASYLQAGSNTNVAAKYGMGGIPYAPTLGGFPDISFGGYINSIGIPSYMPSDELQNVFEFIDNVSKTIGKHNLKAGVNFQHVRFYGLQSANPTGSQGYYGVYTMDPGDFNPLDVTGSGVADFMLDMMNSSSINSDTPFTNLRWYNAAFAQDDWKLTPRLTLNLGLRWEYTQPFVELHDVQANFVGNYLGMNKGTGTLLIPQSQSSYPIPAILTTNFAKDNIAIKYTSNRSLMNPDKKEFAPRLGVAYAINPKTVVRTGAGFFYGGQENIGLGLNLFNNPPFFITSAYNPTPNQCYNTTATGVVCPTNGQTLETGFGAAITTPGGLGAAANLPTLIQQDQNTRSAYTISYNLNVQRAITSSLSATIGYQGNVSRRLRESYPANSYPGVIARGENGQLYQPFYDMGNIIRIANEGEGRYDSLQVKAEQKTSHGLYFMAGYTWSHSLDDAYQPIQGNDGGGYRNPNFLGFKFDYGASNTDVRHRVTFTSQYELPFGKGKPWLNSSGFFGGLLDAVVGGWKISDVFQAQTGTPIGMGGVFRVGNPFAVGGTPNPDNQQNITCATQVKTLAHWYNPCAFAHAPTAITGASDPSNNLINIADAGTLPYGQRGRVTVAGPGFYDFDASLFKSFHLPFHNSALQFRADAINLFNHPTFSDPNNSLTGTSAGKISSTRFSGSTQLPDARVLQVALRLTY